MSQFTDALEKLAVFSRQILSTFSSETQNNVDKTQVQSALSEMAITSNGVETFPSNDFTNISMTDFQKNDYQLQMSKFPNSPDDLARLCRERFDSGDYVLAINYFAQAMQFKDGVDSWLQDYPFYAGAYLFLGESKQGWQRFNEMTNGIVAAISFRNNGNEYRHFGEKLILTELVKNLGVVSQKLRMNSKDSEAIRLDEIIELTKQLKTTAKY